LARWLDQAGRGRHAGGALREDHYFLGLHGLNQDRDAEYVILVGIDGVSAGTVQLTLQGTNYHAPLVNGTAWFRSPPWPFDLSGNCTITVADPQQRAHIYQRTLLECASLHGYVPQPLIIVDRDFHGVEDPYDARLRLAPPPWISNTARLLAARPAPHCLGANAGALTLRATTNLAPPRTASSSTGWWSNLGKWVEVIGDRELVLRHFGGLGRFGFSEAALHRRSCGGVVR
jgi:hypothetical protein